jgi:hypothetical protein
MLTEREKYFLNKLQQVLSNFNAEISYSESREEFLFYVDGKQLDTKMYDNINANTVLYEL